VRIHQLLAGAAAGDAITRIALNTRDVLSRFGSAEVFAHHLDPSAAGHVHPLGHLPDGSPDDVIILRASIGDEALFDVLADRPERLLVAYHNITPPEFFEQLDPSFAELLALGRRQLRQLRPRVAASYADSTFNADDLRSLGYDDVVVVPPLIEPGHLLEELPDGGFAVEIERRAPSELILFVGQLLPHKRCELLISAHHLLTAHHRPDAALVLVGAPRFEDHARSLANFASSLNLARVWFTGAITDRELAELYRRADVFVTASSHEGFCVPVLEAMGAGVPVVTSRAGALPETVGCGGLLLDDVAPPAIAEALDLLLAPNLRARCALASRARARELSYEAAEGALMSFLSRELGA
jgi:glycosyltransferase involved in cell wall biosynthesis